MSGPAKPFVFSIRPRFVAMFRAGTKRRLRTRTAEASWLVEFRTRRPKVSPGERHLIYETAPTMMVVALATIGEIIEGTPSEVWALTQGPGGISRVEFDDYFGKWCETCGGSGTDPDRPTATHAGDPGCEPCGGSGHVGLRPRAVAIEMSMDWLEVPIELPQRAPQSWARWTGRWPLPGMTGCEDG